MTSWSLSASIPTPQAPQLLRQDRAGDGISPTHWKRFACGSFGSPHIRMHIDASLERGRITDRLLNAVSKHSPEGASLPCIGIGHRANSGGSGCEAPRSEARASVRLVRLSVPRGEARSTVERAASIALHVNLAFPRIHLMPTENSRRRPECAGGLTHTSNAIEGWVVFWGGRNHISG